jgi:hypothetical protein
MSGDLTIQLLSHIESIDILSNVPSLGYSIHPFKDEFYRIKFHLLLPRISLVLNVLERFMIQQDDLF